MYTKISYICIYTYIDKYVYKNIYTYIHTNIYINIYSILGCNKISIRWYTAILRFYSTTVFVLYYSLHSALFLMWLLPDFGSVKKTISPTSTVGTLAVYYTAPRHSSVAALLSHFWLLSVIKSCLSQWSCNHRLWLYNRLCLNYVSKLLFAVTVCILYMKQSQVLLRWLSGKITA